MISLHEFWYCKSNFGKFSEKYKKCTFHDIFLDQKKNRSYNMISKTGSKRAKETRNGNTLCIRLESWVKIRITFRAPTTLKSEGEVTSLSGADKREVRDNREKW
jgi:hypothetical protein